MVGRGASVGHRSWRIRFNTRYGESAAVGIAGTDLGVGVAVLVRARTA
jgi:hypothetical protein